MFKSERTELKFLGQKDMRSFSCLFVQSPMNANPQLIRDFNYLDRRHAVFLHVFCP
jgi:hypothetical protein